MSRCVVWTPIYVILQDWNKFDDFLCRTAGVPMKIVWAPTGIEYVTTG